MNRPPRFVLNSGVGLRAPFGLRPAAFGLSLGALLLLAWCVWPSRVSALPAEGLFRAGVTAYRAGDYTLAGEAFRKSSTLQPASGTLQNLGNAEWQQRHAGTAILAWEQALWLDPFNHSARQNLRFARKSAQLEAPDLAWYEVISTWLPVNWWAWIAGVSLWLAVGMGMLPGILRRSKATWQQAVAAVGLMIFLLSVPAHFGVETRSRIGFVLQKGHATAADPHPRSAGRGNLGLWRAGPPNPRARQLCADSHQSLGRVAGEAPIWPDVSWDGREI